jgi:hypothetical protein
LTLTHVPRGVQALSSESVGLALKNVSPKTIHACITNRSGYTWRNEGNVHQTLTSVDHNVCGTTLILEPGQAREWSETINVPLEAVGGASLTAWVEIADPRTCDGAGCDGHVVWSSPVTLNVFLF